MQATQSRLITQFRVLHALLVREMITRYGKTSAGYLWALIEPVGVIILLTALFTQIAHAPPFGQSFALFYATGYVAFHWVVDISSVAARSVHVNRPLLAFSRVSALDTVLARFLLQSLTGIAVGCLILSSLLFWSGGASDISPGPVMLAFCLACLLALGVGLVNCWAFTVSRGWEIAWGVLSRPLLLISCVFYSFEGLPALGRDLLWYNPIVHIVGLVREGVYPTYDPAHVSVSYVTAIASAFIIVGLWSMRAIRARMAFG